MNWSTYIFVSVALLGRLGWAQESGWAQGQANATMCQWDEPRVAVIRDTVFIDGGYLWWVPGMTDGTYGAPTQDGNTLGIVYRLNFSIPFNTSSNISQILTTISKAAGGGAANNIGPQFYDGAMFANDDEYYTYGGLVALTDAYSPPSSQDVEGYEAYWYGPAGKSFTPGFIYGTLPEGVTRYITAGGVVSVPSENKGFYFSGLRSASSGPIFFTSGNESINADVVSNTLISVDMTTQRKETWSNQTLPSNVPGRANPEIVWVPVSKQGVLIAIGGSVDPEFAYDSQSLNDSQKAHDQAANPGLMTTVSVYDVASGNWYNQATSGQSPGALTQGCTVVASAPDNSSHNIYWYGGFDGIDVTKPFSDDVYILSIPSFMWTKIYSGNNTHGRAGHKCVKPYPDQMFVIGGYPPLSGNSLSCLEGGVLQAFNLSSGTWMTSYDPAVWSNYSVPSAITAMIGGSGTGGATTTSPKSWANSSLATIFGTSYDTTKITKWYPYGSASPTNPNPRVPATGSAAASSSGSSGLPSWVAPVLGVVLGLVFLSAILVIWLLWRRRRLFRSQGESLAGTSEINRNRVMSWVRGAEKTPTVTSDETPSSPYDEVEPPKDPETGIVEAAGTEVHEMPDTSQPQELSDTGLRYIPAVAALRPGVHHSGSQTSHTSHQSQSSVYSHGSKDSVSSRGAVSPVLSSTPRAGSPNLGEDSRSRFISGVSASSSDYRALAEDNAHSGAGSDVPIVAPINETAESPKGLGVASPISPPTPQGKEGADYLTHQSTSSQSPQSPQNAQRKSNFGEML